MRSVSIAELMKLAEQTDLGDVISLDVLGQCVLVCTLLDPETEPEIKRQVAKRLASTFAYREPEQRPLKEGLAE